MTANRVTLITLGVADLARARAYYAALGWQEESALDEVVFYDMGGMKLGFFTLDGLARARERDAFERPSSRTVVAGSSGRDDLWRRIAAAVDWLVEARAEGRGYWSYDPQPPGSGAHDYSNTQFAALGLQIGLEYKVPIPREVFEEIARRFIETQTSAGEKRVVTITRAASLESALERRLKPTGRTRVVRPGEVGAERFRVAPGGWGYHGKSNPYASMTGSGASSLTVALADARGVLSEHEAELLDAADGDLDDLVAALPDDRFFGDQIGDVLAHHLAHFLAVTQTVAGAAVGAQPL